jgi:hypothetical protein
MENQNFKNHAKLVPLFHGVTALLLMIGFILALVNFIRCISIDGKLLEASVLLLIFIIAILFFWFIRTFALGAQDRAIRAEENLRYYTLTGKLLDSKLTLRQIIALRFAPDEEFVELVERAIKENLKPTSIKQSIQNWKPDHNRI